ncbi:MAG TPA: LuxR C-terminal-related transcriptional regulator, partial [Streptosporangiaceae bacterium]|nr:LuxR C-terminal-related transcriptional regulator [Streptosporangiaceae bacterium]
MSQWAERNGQAFAWVSVDDGDNDPKVLLTYVAEALDQVEPVGQRVFDALASPASSVPGSVVPRLGAAFAAMTSPVVLVLDDVHLLHDSECRAALSVLAEHVPARSRLALAGRNAPPLQIARLRADDRITEIGPADLALTQGEAAALLRAAKVTLGADDVAALHERTEGWPAGLYLAALYLREGGSIGTAAASFGGDDRLVSEYMQSEFLDRISGAHRAFLTRSAVLTRMSGGLCEAVLDLPGSAATLADLARSNLLLVPLDRRGQWYRYHHLFRDMLLADLERTEPGLVPVLRRRAADWCLANDLAEEALEYSLAAGDTDMVARLVQMLWRPAQIRGRTATLQRWFSWLEDRGGIEGRPLVAMNAAFLAEMTGHPVEAERWADAVDRWQYREASLPVDAYTEAMAATLRAILCRRGPEQMRADADEAAQKFAAVNFAVTVTPLLQGVARVLCGDLDGGDAFFSDAESIEAGRGDPVMFAMTLCERSLVAISRNQWNHAEAFASRACARLSQAGIEDSYAAALTSAVQARAAMRRGDVPAARRELTNALRLRPLMTYAQPHWAVQLRIALIHVHLALGDVAGARTIMREADEILRRRPDLGTLADETQELRDRLATERRSASLTASSLTAAELRVLPKLATHLSFADIAAELFVSPNTAKTHAVSIYRKLDA